MTLETAAGDCSLGSDWAGSWAVPPRPPPPQLDTLETLVSLQLPRLAIHSGKDEGADTLADAVPLSLQPGRVQAALSELEGTSQVD